MTKFHIHNSNPSCQAMLSIAQNPGGNAEGPSTSLDSRDPVCQGPVPSGEAPRELHQGSRQRNPGAACPAPTSRRHRLAYRGRCTPPAGFAPPPTICSLPGPPGACSPPHIAPAPIADPPGPPQRTPPPMPPRPPAMPHMPPNAMLPPALSPPPPPHPSDLIPPSPSPPGTCPPHAPAGNPALPANPGGGRLEGPPGPWPNPGGGAPVAALVGGAMKPLWEASMWNPGGGAPCWPHGGTPTGCPCEYPLACWCFCCPHCSRASSFFAASCVPRRG